MRAIISVGAATAIIVHLGACSPVGPSDDNPFATGTPTMTSTPPSTDSNNGDGSSGTSTSGGGGSSSDGAEVSTGMAESTGALTTGPMMTTGVSMGSSDGGGNGMQPASGMYAPCTVPEDCDATTPLCITITDAMGGVLGGFCSVFPCGNAAVDCDPSPGGTATPACIGVTINMMPDTACYLDCTGGGSCPIPMVCTPLEGGIELCL